ncbi:MAG TPA: Ig-like domain-containing protein [Solirubrobacter sp.]
MQGRIRRLVATTVAAMALFGTGTALADGTSVTGGPSGTTTDATPTFTFTGEPGARFDCKVEPASPDFKPCSSPMTVQLTDGDYTFTVRATDAAGNVETNPPSRAFTVDTSAIDTAIDAGPDGLTNDPTPSFTFSTAASGATFECRIEGANSSVPTYTGCSTPFTAPKLVSGNYTLKVRAKSPDGKVDSTPAERAFTLDADKPETSFTTAPDEGSKITIRTPEIVTASSEPGSTFECRLDNVTKEKVDTVPWAPCDATWKLPQLDGGQHTVEVRATDQAGNTDDSPAKRTFTVLVCDTEVRFGVIEALGKCLANAGTAAVPVWESTQNIKLNGLTLPVLDGQKIVLTGPTPDKPGGTLAITDIKIEIAGIKLYDGGFSWDLPDGKAGEEKEFKKIDLSGAGQKLFGMKVEGYAALRLRRPQNEGGAYKTVFALHVALPEVFKAGPSEGSGGVTGDVSINIDAEGVHLDGLKIQVTNAYIGKLGVKSVCLSFAAAGSSAVAPCTAPSIGGGKPQPYIECRSDNQEDRWDGAIAIVLPTEAKTELGLWGGLRGGRLSHAGAYVDNLGTAVPLAPGVFLQSVRLGVCLEPPPFQVKGGAGISLGPSVNGVSLVRLDGDMHYSDAYGDQPWFIRADGRLRLFDKQVASAYFQYWGTGMIDFGFEAGIDFGPANISGNVDGWIQTKSPSTFNVQGHVEVCVDSVACAEGDAVFSTVGAAGCISVSIVRVPMLVKNDNWKWYAPWRMHVEMVPIKVKGGAGYTWSRKDLDLMLASCSIGKWVLARPSQAGDVPTLVLVPADMPAFTVRMHGKDAPPKVDLVGPDGRRIAMTDYEGGGFVKGSHLIATNPDDNTTSIMVTNPAAGEWKIEPHADSSQITEVDRAYAEPEPTLGAGVGGSGYKRTLGYAYGTNPGQKIQFVERGERTTQVLGDAKPGHCAKQPGGIESEIEMACGQLKFTPGHGPAGKREIVAVITQDGRPRDEKVVATYIAPKDRLPGRPRLLRARRAGSTVMVRWASVPGANGYTASVTTSDGRKLSFAPANAAKAIKVPGIGRDTTVRVALRALRIDGAVGKASHLKVKATRKANVAPRKAKPLKIKKKGGRR